MDKIRGQQCHGGITPEKSKVGSRLIPPQAGYTIISSMKNSKGSVNPRKISISRIGVKIG